MHSHIHYLEYTVGNKYLLLKMTRIEPLITVHNLNPGRNTSSYKQIAQESRMAESSERQQRIDRAMGEMMYQCAMAQTDEEREADKNCSPFASLMQAATKRHEEISNLNDDEVALLKELCSFFDSDHAQGNEVNEVKRAREIIEELQMNVNFQALPR